MAIIYMIHPVHGAKVAISEDEAIYDETNGWMRYDLSTPSAADGDELVNGMAEPKRSVRRRAAQED